MQQVIAPTLLIGLGGIGSSVVEKVYSQLPKDLHEFVAVHAFDTNVNDIRERKGLQGHITQTSRPMTVGDYLHRASDSVLRWFPHENRLLWRKTLTEGAGQVRAVSRLAYLAAMEAGQLSALEKDVSRIFSAKGNVHDQAARVVIVSTLAGGTGAGMFLQTALFIRDLLEKKFSRNAVLIRGAFLLPDALILGNLLDRSEENDVRSNAYACFKELNALIRPASTSNGILPGQAIELEYRPGQEDDAGRPSTALSWKHLPFDFCFLYDYENTRGANLREFRNYLNQLSKTLFLQLFSPLQKDHFSEEDNAIRGLIKAGGMNRYCGAGAATIIYPVDDIVEYCALRWAESNLKDEWLKLDELFEQELRDYERDLRAGVYRDKPVLRKRYVALLDNLSQQGAGGHFFREQWNSARKLDERGNEIYVKSASFLESVKEFVKNVIDNDEDLQAAASTCRVDEGKLKHKQHARSEIRKMESSLEYYQSKLLSSLAQHKSYILNSIFFQDSHHPRCLAGDEPYRLNVWLLKEALHPVAVRYFLYQTVIDIDDMLVRLQKDNHKDEEHIKSYASDRFDIRETEGIKETAEDRLNLVLNENIIKKVFSRGFNDFVGEYKDASSSQLRLLNHFKNNKLLELVLVSLKDSLEVFIANWERYFSRLKDVQLNLLDEIGKRSIEHEGRTDPYRIYVLAGKKDKERLWDALRTQASFSDLLPQDISREIYRGQYRRTCAEQLSNDHQELREETVNQMFRDDVLSWCRQKLKANEGIVFNVIQALQTESRWTGTDCLKTKITEVDKLAEPFVPIRTDSGMEYWGMHPASLDNLSDQQCLDYFGSAEPSIVNEAFSPYEIIRYRASYGLHVEDFPKFSSDPRHSGVYFQAYRRSVAELQADSSRFLTHHLDKRWHLPAYLPDLNPELALKDRSDTERAFILGLLLGFLRLYSVDQKLTWKIRDAKGALHPFEADTLSMETPFSCLFDKLFHYPDRVNKILTMAEKIRLERQAFLQQCTRMPGTSELYPYSVFDAVFLMAKESPTNKSYDNVISLLTKAYEEIRAINRRYLGDKQQNTADKETADLVKNLIEQSEIWALARKENWPVLADWESKISHFLDNPSF